jgi:hypothetical protein
MSRHGIFDPYCREHGCRPLSLTGPDAKTNQMYVALGRVFEDQCATFEREVLARSRKTVKVDVGFCADPSLNAFADRAGNSAYVIGIHAGAFGTLASAFQRLFALAPHLCDGVELAPGIPPGPREGAVATVALFGAMHFLFSHELGHIAYGHTDLYRKAGLRLVEAGSSHKRGPLTADIRQCMEVDADLHAGTSVIAQMAQRRLCGMPLDPMMPRPTDVLRITAVAVLVMFHMFYGREASIDSYRDQAHPLPELRLGKFWMRVHQMGQLPQIKAAFHGQTLDIEGLLDMASVTEFADIFPALRLEGRVNLTAEAARIRANEDRHATELEQYAMLRVGEIVI